MTLPLDKKQWVLGGALLLTLGVSAWLALGMDKTEETLNVVEAAKPVVIKRNTTPHPAAALALPVLATARAAGAGEKPADDIFKSRSWVAAPPPPPKEQAAVIPQQLPPPMPFTYMGTVEDGGQRVVFLAKQQHLFTVRKGEVFDRQYRLEDESKGRIELLYLPLKAKQILVTKGAS
jgi:hypothetical protein